MPLRCTLDLPPAAVAQLDQLAERLHHPSRDALLSFLVVQGINGVRAQLQAQGLGSAIAAHFAPLGGVELEVGQ